MISTELCSNSTMVKDVLAISISVSQLQVL